MSVFVRYLAVHILTLAVPLSSRVALRRIRIMQVFSPLGSTDGLGSRPLHFKHQG